MAPQVIKMLKLMKVKTKKCLDHFVVINFNSDSESSFFKGMSRQDKPLDTAL